MDRQDIWQEFVRIAQSPDDEIDLARAALLFAATEYRRLDIQRELGVLDSLARGVADRLGAEGDPLYCVNTLSRYLFDELGFRGDREEYHDPRNSFLNEVLSRRLGIPITLSLVFIEVGRRLGVPLVGIGMPAHFLVRHRDVGDLFIDPFNGGILLSERECVERLRQLTQGAVPWDPRHLAAVSNREFVARVLRNLKGIYLRQDDHARALDTIDWILALQPDSAPERRDRGLVRYRLGHYGEALTDLTAYLDSAPDGPGASAVVELVAHLRTLLDD